jgi:hypothetical protein
VSDSAEKVMSHQELATAYVRQALERARIPNFWYVGPVCYSYSVKYPLTVINAGERVVHINIDKPRHNGSRWHLCALRGALAYNGYTFLEHDTETMVQLAESARAVHRARRAAYTDQTLSRVDCGTS